jgi:hypothetical protein
MICHATRCICGSAVSASGCASKIASRVAQSSIAFASAVQSRRLGQQLIFAIDMWVIGDTEQTPDVLKAVATLGPALPAHGRGLACHANWSFDDERGNAVRNVYAKSTK